ncbi:MAG: FAD-dependent oxidoreductase [Patescibacteria group bacterium]|nr:FAD-dependent oxidoreductase [Patescibacteria group bacterium]
MKYPKLFSKAKIGTLKLKNRLVMPPMVRNYADEAGKATDRYIEHINRIAFGGAGLLILEASHVNLEGRGFLNQLGIHSDSCLPGLKKLVKVAHDHDAAIAIQLYHAGRQTHSSVTGKKPVAPSAIPCPVMQDKPRALTQKEIQKIVKDFGKAAARAQKAGFDAVEIHSAHGYLIQQFLSPYSNTRTDSYGGSFENRMRFLLEIMESVQKNVGATFPVIVRISGEEMVEGGLEIKEMSKVAELLESAGADAVHVTSGNYGSYAEGHLIPPMAIKDGINIPLAKAIKKKVKIPVIAVAKIRTPELAEKTLKEGSADFIAIGRSLLADPDWPKKAKAGQAKEINQCIACNQGCISRLFAGQDVWCTVNPKCGREIEFGKQEQSPKKLLVIGGGPGGLTAAIIAAERGHQVTLYEESDKLGGQLSAAAAPPHREDWETFRKSLIRQVKALPIEVILDHKCTLEDAKAGKFDAAIVATGSKTSVPKISGVENSNVILARDLFEGKVEAKGKVVVVGGGCMGAQTAEYLAVKNHEVTLVELTENIAMEAPTDDRHLLLGRLEKLEVKTMLKTKVLKIQPDGVLVHTHEQGKRHLPADTVVLCLGSKPDESFGYKLKFAINNVQIIGDAKDARRVTDAVAEGGLAVLGV